MKVLKFGGSSVANAENIELVCGIVRNEAENQKVAVVVSAFSGVTDLLIKAAETASLKNENYLTILQNIEHQHLQAVQKLLPISEQSAWLSFVKKQCNDLEDICNGIFVLGEFTGKIRDRITSYGEFLSSNLIAAKLKSDGLDAVWFNSQNAIKTNSEFTHAKVDFAVTDQNIQSYFAENSHQIVMVPGFIASNNENIPTTLGRGGSDYTAAIIAAALQADELQIWTDVSGMMTSDPRLVSNAKVIPKISYKEAMELSHFGAKVIYPPTISPVKNKGINLWIKNTFQPQDPGTLVTNDLDWDDSQVAVGISNMSKIALLTLEGSGMVGIPGVSAKLFKCLSDEQINVILITQSSSEHSITIAINESEVSHAERSVNHAFEDDIRLGRIDPLKVEKGLSIIALVGENMKNRSGVSGKLFSSLGHNGVNIRAIAQGSSEKNISAVIAEGDVRKAVNVLHEEFFESETKHLHLYICGVGNVGSKLIQQIYSQNDYLKENLRMNLRVAGVSNSRKMTFENRGIEEGKLEENLQNGIESTPKQLAQEIINRNLRNSIFVDVTANDEVVEIYETLLKKSVSIVACNKIAAASSYENYRKLKNLAKNHNCKFFFETNVGAGLPIIGTINDLIKTGDKISTIQAVLSGTLNFVFNNYDGSRSFSEVVKQAQNEGFTMVPEKL